MKKVLLVDDQEQFLKSLKAGLVQYKQQFETLTASNGAIAVEILKKKKIDLVVTDLRMPEMDGFQLLVHLKADYPSIPVIAMSAFVTPKIQKRLVAAGILGVLEKPIKFDVMAKSIFKGLEIGSEEGSLTGISLPSFLQLLEMEQKTCLVEVHGIGEDNGYFHFQKGVLFDAAYDGSKGDIAAAKMIGLDNVKIKLKKLTEIITERRIKNSLPALIVDAMRIKDEASATNEELEPDSKENTKPTAENRKEESVGRKKTDNVPEISTVMKVKTNNEAITKEINQMALEQFLEEFKSIKGFKAAAIMNFTGEVLASETVDSKIDLNLVGATFNDIFRSAHEACDKIGYKACKETSINTPTGTVVMCCSGVNAKVHFHLIGILSADGNQALMKMQFEKILPKVLEELG